MASAALALAVSAGWAQGAAQPTLVGPDCGSDALIGSLSNGHFNAPEVDGRPGMYCFDLGAQVFKSGDCGHAIDVYKIFVGTMSDLDKSGRLKMKRQRALLVGVLAVAAAIVLPAQAQSPNTAGEMAEPDYSSCVETCAYGVNFNTPESDGRPGVKFYYLGMQAYKDKDYTHAIYMLKIAASWAYKPAEYNLGVMYFKGMGIPMDRPLGAAWMFLAAERDTPSYVYARHIMVSDMDGAERTKAYELLQGLEGTYGDKVALHRAKVQWAQTKASVTGSRVGDGAGEYLMVGSGNGASPPPLYGHDTRLPLTKGVPSAQNGWEVFKNGDVTDGSVAYQQFQESDNPYDPIFIKNRTGTVSVEPLQQIRTDDGKQQPSKKDGSAPSSSQPDGSGGPSQAS